MGAFALNPIFFVNLTPFCLWPSFLTMSRAFGTGRLVLCLAVKAFAPRARRAEEDSGPETSQGLSEQAGSRSRLKSSGARKKIVTISSFPSLSSSVAALPQRPAQCSDRSPAWASPRAVMAPARAAASAVGQQVSRSLLCHNLAVVTLAVDSINAPRRRRRMRYFAFPFRQAMSKVNVASRCKRSRKKSDFPPPERVVEKATDKVVDRLLVHLASNSSLFFLSSLPRPSSCDSDGVLTKKRRYSIDLKDHYEIERT